MHDIQQSFGQGSKDANPVDIKWQETLDKVAKDVVTVKFCHTRSFDAENAGSSEATGFVVDAKKG
jgi:pro-apoptotic serine protease NMA111